MAKKLNGDALVSITIRVTQQQSKDIDDLIIDGRIGSTRPEIIKYFLTQELFQLVKDGFLHRVRKKLS